MTEFTGATPGQAKVTLEDGSEVVVQMPLVTDAHIRDLPQEIEGAQILPLPQGIPEHLKHPGCNDPDCEWHRRTVDRSQAPGPAEKHEAEPGVLPCGLSMQHVVQRADITYRQLNHWTTSGRLQAHRHVGDTVVAYRSTPTGSGVPACWPYEEVAKAARVKKLLELGFDLEPAVLLANSRLVIKETLQRLIAVEVDLILAESGEASLRYLLGLEVSDG